MAFGDIVQWKSGAETSEPFVSITFDSTPTEGNLLIACHFTGGSYSDPPSGFSEANVVTNPTEIDEAGMYYKVAGSSESTLVEITGLPDDEQMLTVLEVEGPWNATPLGQTAVQTRQPATSNPDSGTTGTTSQADKFAMVTINARKKDADNASSWTNSFTELDEEPTLNAKSLYTAYRVLTATGTYDTSPTLVTAAICMGIIATFKKAATGISIPVVMHHRQMQGIS